MKNIDSALSPPKSDYMSDIHISDRFGKRKLSDGIYTTYLQNHILLECKTNNIMNFIHFKENNLNCNHRIFENAVSIISITSAKQFGKKKLSLLRLNEYLKSQTQEIRQSIMIYIRSILRSLSFRRKINAGWHISVQI